MNEENADANRCDGCYQSHFDRSWWCDNCDQWPCTCVAATTETPTQES